MGVTAARDETGASATEYGLLVAGVAALIVTVVFLLGGNVLELFNSSCDTINTDNAAHAGHAQPCS